MATKFPTVDTTAIPEVERYQIAKQRLNEFREANAPFFEAFAQLAHEYNEAVDEAERVVKSKKVSCGDFEIYQDATTFDPDAALELLGRKRFLECGGKEETVRKLSIDKKRMTMAIEANVIDPESAKLIRKVSPRYRKKGRVELP